MDSLRGRTIAGIGWVTVIMGTSRVVRLGSKLILANLLIPRHFGLAALALIFTMGVDLVRKLGLDDALIAQQNRVQEAADTALLIHGALGSVFYLFLYLCAPFIAPVFNEPPLVPVLRVTGIIILFRSLATVPSSLLEKELQFRRKLLPSTVPQFAFAAVAILLATRGAGVWSIIIGEVVAAGGTMMLLWYVVDYRPSWQFDFSLARQLVSFGSHVMTGKLSAFTYQRVDDLVVGKVLASTALGYYSIAYTVSNLPTNLINKPLSRALFPAYSKADDRGKKEAWLYSIRVLSSLAIPSGVGIIVIAPELVHTLLGPEWIPTIPVIRLLAVYGTMRAIVSGSGGILKTTGSEVIFGRLLLANAILLSILIYPFSTRGGLLGAGAAVIISAIPNHGGQLVYAARSLDVSLQKLISIVIQYLLLSVVMAGAVFSLKEIVLIESVIGLSTLVIGGVLTYSVLLLVFDRQLLQDLFEILQQAYDASSD